MFKDPITGIEYEYKTHMYKAHNITRGYYGVREKNGMKPEEIILEYISKEDIIYTDPITGITYSGKVKMYRDNGISFGYYHNRELQGMTPAEIILEYKSKPRKKPQIHIDPITGEECSSKSALFNKYKMSKKFQIKREKEGMTPEQIVLEFVSSPKKKGYIDPITGIKYSSKAKMYTDHGVSSGYYKERERKGMSPEEIILEHNYLPENKTYLDPISNEYLTIPEFIKNYNLKNYSSCYDRFNRYSIIASIGISIMIPKHSMNINQTKYNLTVSKRIKKNKDIFECYIDNGDGTSTFKIMSYDMIDQYCLEQYKKLHNL